MYHVLNLGAGVQSSTMALMAAHGEIEPMPDFAVFADTQDEPQAVYRWLDWLETQLPFPVHRVTAGRLRDKATEMKTTKDGRTFSQTAIPVFTRNEDDSQGRIPHRTCTRDFKIRPIHRFIKQHLQLPNKTQRKKQIAELAAAALERGELEDGEIVAINPAMVTQWMGISLDEVVRMKDSRDWWTVHRFPLIEKRMHRTACLAWMERQGYPTPPRSACIYCPFRSNSEWRRLKESEPESFADAVAFERELTAIKAASDTFKSRPFLHRSLKPLDEVDFRSDFDKGQLPLWQDECEGMCGV